jgi:hypothetical protein
MTRPLLVTSAIVLGLVTAGFPLLAHADTTLERHEQRARTIAPHVETLPGKTLCVCRSPAEDPAFLGYLNYFVFQNSEVKAIALRCIVPGFNPSTGIQSETLACPLFEIIK